jgi:hypothetical protein
MMEEKTTICYSAGQQRLLHEFARRVGGQVLSDGGVELPDGTPCELIQERHPDIQVSTAGGHHVTFQADVCNGTLFVYPGPSPFERYPNGRPVELGAYVVILPPALYERWSRAYQSC